MNPPRAGSIESPSRRFLLLPEDGEAPTQRPAIRRYRLTGIGRRAGLDGTDLATARIAGELGRLRRPYG